MGAAKRGKKSSKIDVFAKKDRGARETREGAITWNTLHKSQGKGERLIISRPSRREGRVAWNEATLWETKGEFSGGQVKIT